MGTRIILTAVLFLMSFGLFAQESGEWRVSKGQQGPAFEVVDQSGNRMTSESLKGKVVLINFFATWCPPCRQELPRLQKEIYDKNKDRSDFEVMVLAREEGWDKLNPFIQSNSYTFPIYPDLNRGVYGLFAENTIPRNVVLDKEGKIIYLSIGFSDKEFDKLIKTIDKELNKK
ncbi:TlpA family protein disulfide reductase [Sphingobacterium hungaricum]